MAKTKEQKREIVKTLEQELKKAKSLIFVDYYGLSVKEIDKLKKILREKKCLYLTAKKTLLKLALVNAGFKVDLDKIKGGIGLAYGPSEETELSKIVEQFVKTHQQLAIQGGIFNAEFVEADIVRALATLPGRRELTAKIVGAIKAPLNNLVYVLSGNIRGLLFVLRAIRKHSKLT